MAKLRGHEIVGIYSDEASDTVAFMLDNHWAVVYKYQPDAGVCFREHRIDEPFIDAIIDRSKEPIELKRLEDSKGK